MIHAIWQVCQVLPSLPSFATLAKLAEFAKFAKFAKICQVCQVLASFSLNGTANISNFAKTQSPPQVPLGPNLVYKSPMTLIRLGNISEKI